MLRFLFTQHIEDDETMKAVIHRHWIFGVKAVLFSTFLIIALVALIVITKNVMARWVEGAVLILLIIWWMRTFLDYFLDAWVITDHGIIDLAWHGWFHRESTRVLYSDIQGVSYEMKGILGTLFRFGDIAVEKISTGTTISLTQVPVPRRVQTLILQSMETYVHSKNLKDAKTVQGILSDFVASSMQKGEFSEDEE
jgi:uncharacterized membrane protein YdbT with pleckstrin-like domain